VFASVFSLLLLHVWCRYCVMSYFAKLTLYTLVLTLCDFICDLVYPGWSSFLAFWFPHQPSLHGNLIVLYVKYHVFKPNLHIRLHSYILLWFTSKSCGSAFKIDLDIQSNSRIWTSVVIGWCYGLFSFLWWFVFPWCSGTSDII
jgi:hypothetical protein